ncbi:MAG: hypothetical protein M1569_04155 [Candidatus Marsarchaeota archaeon]|nr:hypothetical protein [Candidatus Marsarchaeota archaeon]MCL5413565.1 hypothetical protein [Candidatus Marsarchaeota archaeon]
MASKQVLVYLGLLVFLIVATMVLLPSRPGPTHTTTLTTSVKKPSAITVNSTSIPTTTAFAGNASCISSEPTASIPNGAFSNGTYGYWVTNGLGFGSAPTNIKYANGNRSYYGSPWAGYTGDYFASNFRGGTSVVSGNLTSDPFLVTEPYLNFKLISTQNNQLYVQILQNGTPRITTYFNTYAASNNVNATSTFVNASISLLPLLCKNIQIKVIGDTVGTLINQYNYIAVTGFYMSRHPASTAGILVNQSVNIT